LTPLKKFVKVVRKTQFIQRLKKQPENFRGISVAEVAKAAKQKILPRYFATEDLRERTFLSEILRSLPVLMHETTWLCDFIALAGKSGHGASSPMVDHVIKTMHVLKVLVARCCWCQVIGHLRDEKETLTAQYDQLKEKFNRCRTEYLIEVAALRDAQQQLVNLDEVFPQTGGGGGHMALFEPLEALHPEEKDYALRAVQEKLKMILERDPCGNLSMNKAQLDSLGKMQSEEEVNELKKHNQELEEALEKFEERCKNIKLGNASNQADKADKAHQEQAELRKENQVLQQQVSELQEQLTKLRRASSMPTSRIDSRTRRSSQAETRKELAAAAAAAVAAVMAREDENDAAALAAAVATAAAAAAAAAEDEQASAEVASIARQRPTCLSDDDADALAAAVALVALKTPTPTPLASIEEPLRAPSRPRAQSDVVVFLGDSEQPKAKQLAVARQGAKPQTCKTGVPISSKKFLSNQSAGSGSASDVPPKPDADAPVSLPAPTVSPPAGATTRNDRKQAKFEATLKENARMRAELKRLRNLARAAKLQAANPQDPQDLQRAILRCQAVLASVESSITDCLGAEESKEGLGAERSKDCLVTERSKVTSPGCFEPLRKLHRVRHDEASAEMGPPPPAVKLATEHTSPSDPSFSVRTVPARLKHIGALARDRYQGIADGRSGQETSGHGREHQSGAAVLRRRRESRRDAWGVRGESGRD